MHVPTSNHGSYVSSFRAVVHYCTRAGTTSGSVCWNDAPCSITFPKNHLTCSELTQDLFAQTPRSPETFQCPKMTGHTTTCSTSQFPKTSVYQLLATHRRKSGLRNWRGSLSSFVIRAQVKDPATFTLHLTTEASDVSIDDFRLTFQGHPTNGSRTLGTAFLAPEDVLRKLAPFETTCPNCSPLARPTSMVYRRSLPRTKPRCTSACTCRMIF